MAPPAERLHVFFFPLMAPGHTLPMVDIAKLFASRNVKVTLLTIPSSMPLLSNMISRTCHVGEPINLISLPLHRSSPNSTTFFPGGHENLVSLPNVGHSVEFFEALESLRQPLDQILRDHRPDCIVSDMFLPWTAEVACALSIPRLVFHGMGFFPLCVLDAIAQYKSFDDLPQVSNGGALLPNLPHHIEMKRSQFHDSFNSRNKFSEFMDWVEMSDRQSSGAVVNSFYELEPRYADHYRDVMKKKAWHVGPVSLVNYKLDELIERGGAPASFKLKHGRNLTDWLDAKAPFSVLYVCFGSLARITNAQLQEISLALRASCCSFVWVMRDEELIEEMMIEEEEGSGLIIRGWAPQMLILRHFAIGGFMMHCGWNSVMESVSAGVPMITWPLFAEQFYTERLVVDVLRVGLAVGAEEWGMREEEKQVIAAEKIGSAIAGVMDGGEEAAGRRERARGLGKMARSAVAAGGSSHDDLGRLIEELRSQKALCCISEKQ